MKRVYILLFCLVVIGCDVGVDSTTPATQWRTVANFRWSKSNWLNFISVEAYVDGRPDSLKIVLHDDNDATYTTHQIDGGRGSIYAKFFFSDGYVAALPFNLHLSVYVK